MVGKQVALLNFKKLTQCSDYVIISKTVEQDEHLAKQCIVEKCQTVFLIECTNGKVNKTTNAILHYC